MSQKKRIYLKIMKRTTSKKPGKQRKWAANAQLHNMGDMMSSMLSGELAKKYKRASIRVRKGDTVKIMRGEFRGQTGEVTKVDPKKCKIYVEGITIKKSDGTDVERSIHPSNVKITDLYIDDKERRAVLERNIG